MEDDGIGERVFLSVEANLVLSGKKTVCCGLVLVIIYIRLYAMYASNLKQWGWDWDWDWGKDGT